MKNPLHVITFLILTIISLVAIKNNYLTGSNFVDNHSIVSATFSNEYQKITRKKGSKYLGTSFRLEYSYRVEGNVYTGNHSVSSNSKIYNSYMGGGLSNISVYVHNNHPDISSLFKPEPKTGWLIFSIICLIICAYSTYYGWVLDEEL